MIGCFMFFYESYYCVCVIVCQKEMIKVGFVEGMCFLYCSFRKNIIDYIFILIVVLFYGIILSFQVEMVYLWMIDFVYMVSKKVSCQ